MMLGATRWARDNARASYGIRLLCMNGFVLCYVITSQDSLNIVTAELLRLDTQLPSLSISG